MKFDIDKHPHRRYNPLTNEWILVSPQRNNRPWQGQVESTQENSLPDYDKDCYLCPTNTRANGEGNPDYKDSYVFDNDFPALLQEHIEYNDANDFLFQIQPETGINRVVCFSPKHNITLAEMEVSEIEKVVEVWKSEYINLGKKENINYIQIFENKGAIMGCSNPHPHGQIWAQKSLPTQVEKTQKNLKQYFEKHKSSLLYDYLKQELEKKERIVSENNHFVVLVPFWATWPFETLVVSKRHFTNISEMEIEESLDFARIIKEITVKYDNLFNSSFPYSAGIHQAPTDNLPHPEWHFHMHFYPPLLRSATVKKFMVGYEMLGEAQRDISPEKSASVLRNLPNIHYKR